MARLIDLRKKDSDIKYTDGITLENKMLAYAKKENVKFSSNEEWPVTYHFSKYREGILNWYPFKKNCTILEIGSGCGAITRMLCGKAKKVVSVELEYNRAIINYERNKEINNLDIFVGDINTINIEHKFDYVILNGVLEYSEFITNKNSDNAYIELLKTAKSFLEENGTMLISIENRLGIKYLTGSKEDHLNSIFVGINGYKDSKIKTFSKQELTNLLKKANCNITKWYYPYPDYKFPFEIFSDASINTMYPSVMNLPLDFNQIELIDSDSLYQSFMNNNIMNNFANSFLVEINNEGNGGIDYVKLSSLRKKDFSIYTTIDFTKNIVTKKSIYKDGLKHIKNICNNKFENSLLKTIDYRYAKDCSVSKVIKGNTLLDEVLNDSNKLIPILQSIYQSLIVSKATIKKSSKKFTEVFGNIGFDTPLHWIKNANIDLLLNHIYVTNRKYLVIDPEWQFDFYVPAEYIVWRILFNLPQNGLCDRNKIKKEIKKLGIDSTLCDKFKEMELNFVFNYVGTENLPHKKIKRIDINSIFKD